MRRSLAATTMATAIIGCLVLGATPARAGLLTFGTSAGFTTQVTTDGLALKGSENFESASALGGGATSVAVNDSLAPGVNNPPFASGTNAALGMTVQSNTLGASPTTTSPRGTGGMLLVIPGYLSGTPSKQIGTNQPGDSLDLIFGTGIKAVNLTALFYASASTSATSHPGTIEWEVFSSSNVSLGAGSLANVDFSQDASDFLGFVATGTDTIGRINLFAVGTENFAGADDISGFIAGQSGTGGETTVAEPASLAVLGAGLLGLFGIRRRRG